MNIELLKITLDLLSAWADVHFSSKGRSFDRQADFTSVHKTLWSQKKKEEKFKYASIGLQVSYQFVSIFSFCCLASLQELRIQVGGHHESFCIFWNLVFTPNKLSVYTEIKDWNTSKLTKTEYWNGVSCETRLPRVSEYFVIINFFFQVLLTRCLFCYIFSVIVTRFPWLSYFEQSYANIERSSRVHRSKIGYGMQPKDKT